MSSACPSCRVTLPRRSACRRPRLSLVRLAGRLHDIGKSAIPAASSTSPARLMRRSRSSCTAIPELASASCSPPPPWPERLRSFAQPTSASTDTDIRWALGDAIRSGRASSPSPTRSTPSPRASLPARQERRSSGQRAASATPAPNSTRRSSRRSVPWSRRRRFRWAEQLDAAYVPRRFDDDASRRVAAADRRNRPACLVRIGWAV